MIAKEVSDQLVLDHLYLINYSCEKVYRKWIYNNRIPMDEAKSVAALGLVIAARDCKCLETFKAFAIRVIRNSLYEYICKFPVISGYRFKQRKTVPLTLDVAQDSKSNLLEDVLESMKKLTVKERALIKMYYLDEEDDEYVARKLNLTKRSVRERRFQSMKKLRGILNDS